MDEATPTILAIMGSGETSPTMVTVHRTLADQLPTDRRTGVVLDAPYGFQTNAADISARARGYFARSVGLPVEVLSDGPALPEEAVSATLRAAPWVFAGPGSPSYALSRWRGHPVGQALCDRIRTGPGLTVLASAAAATLGRFAVPVYEIYKVGAALHWLDGLDALRGIGLVCAVIPHYDNAEGGTHDTRFCYLGEQRLSMMELQLPEEVFVLGIDEHTAAIVDLTKRMVTVAGRGGLTIRTRGRSTVLPSGTEILIDHMRDIAHGQAGPGLAERATAGATRPEEPSPVPPPLRATTDAEAARFDAAMAAKDIDSAVGAILALEAAISEWSADTEEDEGTRQARAVLRTLVVRLGELAALGARDPREVIDPYVSVLLELRERARQGRDYAVADWIRDRLTQTGIEVHDTRAGVEWAPGGSG